MYMHLWKSESMSFIRFQNCKVPRKKLRVTYAQLFKSRKNFRHTHASYLYNKKHKNYFMQQLKYI